MNERAHALKPSRRILLPISFGKILLLAGLGLFAFLPQGFTLGQARYVETVGQPGSFPIAQAGAAANLWVDTNDFAGVIRAAGDLQADIVRVTGITPALAHEESRLGGNVIVIGTIGKSAIIDRLIREGKIDMTPITGKWESFLIQVVPNPLPGVASGLVIAGSDKRGTIFGIYRKKEESSERTTEKDALRVTSLSITKALKNHLRFWDCIYLCSPAMSWWLQAMRCTAPRR